MTQLNDDDDVPRCCVAYESVNKVVFINVYRAALIITLVRSTLVIAQHKSTPDLCINNVQLRVAKCHRYGRYICVKILESWGKKYLKTTQFCKIKQFWGNFHQFWCGFIFKPAILHTFSP